MDALRELKLLKLEVRTPQNKVLYAKSATTSLSNLCYNCIENFPKTVHRGKTLWSKGHIDRFFAKRAPSEDITEWYTASEIQQKFGMTLSAIYNFVHKEGIPKKKEKNVTYYSKRHFDIAKGIAEPEPPAEYTIAEATARFGMTRDQLYHYVKAYNITRTKRGKYTYISRKELDDLLAPPSI